MCIHIYIYIYTYIHYAPARVGAPEVEQHVVPPGVVPVRAELRDQDRRQVLIKYEWHNIIVVRRRRMYNNV